MTRASVHCILREEMTAIVLASPGDSISPAGFRRFRNDAVIHLKWQVRLRLERGDSLANTGVNYGLYKSVIERTIFMGGRFLTLGSVKTATYTVLGCKHLKTAVWL